VAGTFLWQTGSGSFGSAANWLDIGNGGTVAAAPPGVADTATLDGPVSGSAQTVSGGGAVASLDVTGRTLLTGAYAAGAVSIGDANAAGTLTLSGASVVVSGTLTLGASPSPAGTLAVTSSSTLQAAALAMFALSTLSVDSSSVAEIGLAGGAQAGVLTVDARATLTAANGTVRAPVVNSGIIAATSYGLAITGTVTGGGTLEVGAGARLDLSYGGAASTQTVAFLANTGTLFTPPSGLDAGVTGFSVGDAIVVGQSIDGASFINFGGGYGVLSLTLAGSTVAQVPLVGNYATVSFLASGQTVTELASGGGGSGPASGGTPGPDVYAWTADGGDWRIAGNWWDQTAGANPAAVAPGVSNLVTVGGPTGASFQVLTGPGNAASLTFTGNTAVTGTIDAAALVVGGSAPGQLLVQAGASVIAGSAQVVPGTLTVSGAGATLAVAGTLVLGNGSQTAALSVASHGAAQAGAVILNVLASIQIDAVSRFEVGTSGGAAAGVLTVDAGATLAATGGSIAANIADAGTISVSTRQLSLTGAVSGAGILQIGTGGSLDLSYGSAASSVTIDFAGAGGALFTPVTGFAGDIAGFAAGDVIGVGQSVDTASWAQTSAGQGLLTLSDGGTPVTALALLGNYAGQPFIASGHAVSVASVPCYAAGTRILTDAGEVAVEDLAVGDTVVTVATGVARRTIVWAGRRTVDCAAETALRPVVVAADAFGPGAPRRQLMLSPDHAVLVDGFLVPIRYLINGATICRDDARDEVTYVHIELDAHDAVLAEGLACESFLDTGNRGELGLGGESAPDDPVTRRDRALAIWQARGCAPLLIEGAHLAALHRRLMARAAALGWRTTEDARPELHVERGRVRVWRCGTRLVARLPPGAGALRLLSRAAVPIEFNPECPDRRRLGVAVRRVVVDGRVLDLDDAAFAEGWHPPESGAAGAWRWTDGAAVLRCAGAEMVTLALLPVLRYWQFDGSVEHPAENTAVLLV